MTFTKSLLAIGIALAAGTALAGGSMSHSQSSEAANPELLSEAWASSPESPSFPMNGSESYAAMEPYAEERFAEADVIYIYPMQVTEYYLLVPSVDTEMPQG